MNKFVIIVFLALFIFCRSAISAEFVEGMEDVPVAKGLTQIQNNNIDFGNNETRFVEAYLTSSRGNFAKVSGFYKNTLPQLGWKFIKKTGHSIKFERDAEVLDIAQEKKSPFLIRITLKTKD